MSGPPSGERLTAVLRAAQYLSNVSPEQEPWAELGKALHGFLACHLAFVLERGEDLEPRLLREPALASPPHDLVLRLLGSEIRAVLDTGFLDARVLDSPAYAVALLPVARERRPPAAAVVVRSGLEPFSHEELEILLALGGLFSNVLARVETERVLREGRQNLEQLIAERTAELASTTARLAQESAERRSAELALEQAHAELEQIFQTAADGLWVLDRDGTVRRVNATQAARLGRRASEIVGRSCRELSPCRDCETRTCPLTRIAQGDQRVESELRREYSSGPKDDVVVSTPFRSRDGALLGIVQVFHDITERKKAEEGLRESEARLREADRRKTEFMAMLSHELRNPLAPIRNSLYLLQRVPPGGEQARRAHSVIDRQISHLTRLVDDLLDLTRVSRGKIRLQMQEVDLGELVCRTVEDHRSLFDERGVKLVCEPPAQRVVVHGDSVRLAQVVGNLLANAAKFTPQGGETRVRVWAEPRERRVLLRVTDTGAGLSEATLARLFEPFVQADVTLDRSKGGLGLGLALVKELMRLHGGDIRASSEGLGRGATFDLWLPLSDAAAQALEALHPAAACSGRRVLVIEDNVDAADSLRELLEMHGHAVEVAYEGVRGLAIAREFLPEVVLCDIGLPGMCGFDVAKAFRAEEALRKACLVALSGYAQGEDRRLAAEAGFDHHLAKPLDLTMLQAILSRASSPS